MSRRHKPKAFWRLARIWFRHFRITVWLVVFLLLVAILYLHNVGLPGFAQRAVLSAFERRGLDLQFAQLKLSWFRGIVAKEVRLQPVGGPFVPSLECDQVDLAFNPAGLLRLRIEPDQITAVGGRLLLPWEDSNGTPGHLTATNLQALIRFDPGGRINLAQLQGEIAGCRVTASGTVTHPEQVRDWRVLQGSRQTATNQSNELWPMMSRVREETEFLSPPRLRLAFQLDGAAPEQLMVSASLQVDAAVSRLGLLQKPELRLHVRPAPDGACTEVDLMVQADEISSAMGRGRHVAFQTTFSCVAETGGLLAGRATLSAAELNTRWAGARNLEASIGWRGDGTNPIPSDAVLRFSATHASTRQGSIESARGRVEVTPHRGDHRRLLELPDFLFPRLQPYDIRAELEASRVSTPWQSATNVALYLAWSCRARTPPTPGGEGGGGGADLRARFNAITGRVEATADSDFDPHRLHPLLPRVAVEWLDLFRWDTPPVVHGELGITLPPWRPLDLGWPGDLRPSLYLNGDFRVDGTGAYRRIPLSGASGAFTYSNMCWHLPGLTLVRPDGRLRLRHFLNERTSEFYWTVDGAMDPTPVLILVPETAVETRAVLETLRFGGPPEMHLTLAGLWNNLRTSHAWGSIRATNMAFRGVGFDAVSATLGMTNLVLSVNSPEVQTAGRTATADRIVFDFPRHRALLSNGVSRVPPLSIATVIGPAVVRAIEPYHFLTPPSGRVEGVIPLKGVAGADLRFDLEGGPFHWWNFKLDQVKARVHWRDETVDLRIHDAAFYEGRASGQAFFDFTGKKDADFEFHAQVETANAQPLVADVFQSTNRLEGRLTGAVSITNANTGDFSSWFGYGHADLKDGYLWNAPIFGIVSPVIDVFVPGLGSSQATDANGRFVITNSVFRTEDLVIHTSNMRLLYSGTLDFHGRVDAVAEAEILRDTFIVGELVSAALTPLSKAMIIDITGTLSEPVARPLYLVPRMILAPLNPVKLLKDMFAPAEKPSPESAPPPAPPHSKSPAGQ